MRHIKEVDGKQHTVIMMQVENESGVLGDSRDRSKPANEAYNKPVPKELMDYLQKHKDTLLPEIRDAWQSSDSKHPEPGRRFSVSTSRTRRTGESVPSLQMKFLWRGSTRVT